MVILGVPYNPEDYFMADDQLAFVLQQKGFQPKYFDNGASFFKKNNKLAKVMQELGIKELV